MNAELAEQLERYRRRHIHLVTPSTEAWQHSLDTETYFPDENQQQIASAAELLHPPQGTIS